MKHSEYLISHLSLLIYLSTPSIYPTILPNALTYRSRAAQSSEAQSNTELHFLFNLARNSAGILTRALISPLFDVEIFAGGRGEGEGSISRARTSDAIIKPKIGRARVSRDTSRWISGRLKFPSRRAFLPPPLGEYI